MRVAPLTDLDVMEMVRELTTFPLLDGFRGATKKDVSRPRRRDPARRSAGRRPPRDRRDGLQPGDGAAARRGNRRCADPRAPCGARASVRRSGRRVSRDRRRSDPRCRSQSPPRPSRNSRAARFEPSTYEAACRPCLATRARPRSASDPRWRKMIPTNPHSSRKRRHAESSQPSGISPTGFDSPRLNARDAHVHQGVSRSTTVSARASRSSSVSRSLPSAIQALPASTRRCVSRHSSSEGLTQPGFHWYRSR